MSVKNLISEIVKELLDSTALADMTEEEAINLARIGCQTILPNSSLSDLASRLEKDELKGVLLGLIIAGAAAVEASLENNGLSDK